MPRCSEGSRVQLHIRAKSDAALRVRDQPARVDEPLVISTDRFKYWQVDFQSGKIRIVCQDGQILEEELEPRFRVRDSQVASSIFDWEKWWILSTTPKDDLIITEGFNPASPPPLNGRPAVYPIRIAGGQSLTC